MRSRYRRSRPLAKRRGTFPAGVGCACERSRALLRRSSPRRGGPRGSLEKEVVLDVAAQLAARLRERGLRVVLTRDSDRFVPLERRTAIANDARGDLFVSIHANAAEDHGARGVEAYFLSLDATDEAAARVAERENGAFPPRRAASAPGHLPHG